MLWSSCCVTLHFVARHGRLCFVISVKETGLATWHSSILLFSRVSHCNYRGFWKWMVRLLWVQFCTDSKHPHIFITACIFVSAEEFISWYESCQSLCIVVVIMYFMVIPLTVPYCIIAMKGNGICFYLLARNFQFLCVTNFLVDNDCMKDKRVFILTH